MPGSVALKVVDESRRVVAAEIMLKIGLSVLRSRNGRKPNLRAENCLALVSQAAEERDDSPGVKARGRFVQEEQKLRLGGELNSDGCTLAVFDIECSNNSLGVLIEATHADTFLDAAGAISRWNIKFRRRTYYASFSAKGTEGGWRNLAENNKASRTVWVGTWVSIC